ncbi:lipase maturation factor family protein [Ruicaihuangia caeni]|uniref:lipase maturation factor family protein n=1 Tax=Ruicaihuangia caeni TaxID=3042517 RepID=UPI00338DAF93
MEWLEWFDAHDFEFARQVVQRGTAALYLIAFLTTVQQFPALLGEKGLLPATELLKHPRYLRSPTIFKHWRYTDRRLIALCIVGIAIAVALIAGFPQLGPPWVPLIAFLAMWGIYLSIFSIGQTFYGFGWEMLLIEMGFTVAFLGSDQVPPPTTILLLICWLVFRLEFGAGMIKMRGDRAWRNLTAMYYHHETQPMPGPLSRQAHLLPKWFHRVEAAGNHAVQLVVPFLLFVPYPVGSIAAALIILTQLWLVFTGNFAWLNWATIVLAFAAVNDRAVHAVLPFIPTDLGTDPSRFDEPGLTGHAPVWWFVIVIAATVLLVVVAYPPLMNLVSRRQLMNASFNRWQLGNAYGAFGSVTRARIEYVIEATNDDPSDPGAEWHEYEFLGKPGDVRRMPPQWAPFHLRLDWLMWFLPLGRGREPWFDMLLIRLLEADEPTLRLLRKAPFGREKPRAIRVLAYRYRFSTHEQYRRTGQRWMRVLEGVLVRPISFHSGA